MGIRKRQGKFGETSEYHYEFMQNGKRYYGVCEGCTTKIAAANYEKKVKETVKKLAEQNNATALVQNFKRELVGGQNITIDDAFSIYLQKPAKRLRGKKQVSAKQAHWNDFCAFLKEHYPEIQTLDRVTRSHAEEYIGLLKSQGRFVREIQNGKKAAYRSQEKLSNATINVYHKTLRSVFEKLKEDAGVLYNPFSFEMLENSYSTREAFSMEELQLIDQNVTPFVRPIFLIGMCTGLSEGDICLLRWTEIRDGWIYKRRRKTGVQLDIPILPPLQVFLEEQRKISGNDKYVLPEHAAMYLKNPSGISYRVKQFLEGIGIQTTRRSDGRTRASSVKDVHSLRHTFAYLAGCSQIPLTVVQSILGHMSPEMTKHYQAHTDRKTKEKFLSLLPNFISTSKQQVVTAPIPQIESSSMTIKEKIICKINKLSQAKLKILDNFLNTL